MKDTEDSLETVQRLNPLLRTRNRRLDWKKNVYGNDIFNLKKR